MFALRDYAPADFEQLWQLDQECFPAGIAYPRSELEYFLTRKSSTALVAEQSLKRKSRKKPRIAGFIVAERAPKDAGHIITIDVHPKLRRSGLGTLLMSSIEERLHASFCTSVLLEVAIDNVAALSFYKRLGYSVLKTLPRYYNGTMDGLLLGKKLL